MLQAILSVREQTNEEPQIIELDHSKELTKDVRKTLLSRAMETEDMDNQRFLEKVAHRLERCAHNTVLPPQVGNCDNVQQGKRKSSISCKSERSLILCGTVDHDASCRAQVSLPEVDVTFQNISVSAKGSVATRALPSIPNYFLNLGEVFSSPVQHMASLAQP